jgi:hypothetical protein
MKLEKRERKLRARQYVTLDATSCANEVGLDVRRVSLQGSRDCQRWVEVPARSTAGKQDAH